MHLDAGGVYKVLDRYVHALLPTYAFAIVLQAPGGAMEMAFGTEAGAPLAPFSIAPGDDTAWSPRCVAERREIVVDDLAQHAPAVDTCEHCASALFAPLLLGERVLGAMCVQARQRAAYGERERLIFRTLCAYGAIALDNAQAYRQLQEAQSQLAAQEKLAALGALMAGVAHELNTPIGNSLLIASTLEQKTLDLEHALNGPGLRRSELAAYIDDARKAAELVMRGLHNAADLVASFKQVAVDRTTEQRRRFLLHQVTREIVATMMNRIRASNHRIAVDVPEGIALDSYPGPFGQVITNFINNALLHAFEGREGGTMQLTATAGPDGKVTVVFADDGGGIARDHLSRIFDPFFTTKLGRGGSGLGLSISYNIVTGLLGGQISVASGTAGTAFTLELPLVAPAPGAEHRPRIY
jgi:signal transduction histidine kinase